MMLLAKVGFFQSSLAPRHMPAARTQMQAQHLHAASFDLTAEVKATQGA